MTRDEAREEVRRQLARTALVDELCAERRVAAAIEDGAAPDPDSERPVCRE